MILGKFIQFLALFSVNMWRERCEWVFGGSRSDKIQNKLLCILIWVHKQVETPINLKVQVNYHVHALPSEIPRMIEIRALIKTIRALIHEQSCEEKMKSYIR